MPPGQYQPLQSLNGTSMPSIHGYVYPPTRQVYETSEDPAQLTMPINSAVTNDPNLRLRIQQPKTRKQSRTKAPAKRGENETQAQKRTVSRDLLHSSYYYISENSSVSHGMLLVEEVETC